MKIRLREPIQHGGPYQVDDPGIRHPAWGGKSFVCVTRERRGEEAQGGTKYLNNRNTMKNNA
jgi:hypothetical protein